MASRTDRAPRMVAVCVGALAAVATVHGAETQDAAKPDFSGTWTLDRAISTDPAQIEFAQAATPARQSRGGFGGFGRGGGGGSRRRADTGSSPEGLTQVEQSRLKALTEQLKTASSTLVISHHDPDFIVNDAKDHTLFLHTNGEREENTLGDTTISSSTHWADARIVTECVLGSRLTLLYTYTLVPNTKQLVVRVARQTGDRRSAGQDVRLVYRQK